MFRYNFDTSEFSRRSDKNPHFKILNQNSYFTVNKP